MVLSPEARRPDDEYASTAEQSDLVAASVAR
jgi:hypothetical protein